MPLFLCMILDAPKISNLSSCTHGDVIVYSCEAHGNPCPKLEWHLSGHSISNSTYTFISEEQLSSTYMRSIITLQPSLTDTLQCVGTNGHGTASQRFHLCPQETACKLHDNLSLFLRLHLLIYLDIYLHEIGMTAFWNIQYYNATFHCWLTGFNINSMLVGFAIGALVMAILWVTAHIYK